MCRGHKAANRGSITAFVGKTAQLNNGSEVTDGDNQLRWDSKAMK